MAEPMFKLLIPGRPIVKKNTKRIFGSGRFKKIVYTSRYRAWHLNAMAVAKSLKSIALIECPVVAHYRFFFKNRQAEADVSNLCEAPGDLLQDAGVIGDDRQIQEIWAAKYFGCEERTEIEIFSLKTPGGPT